MEDAKIQQIILDTLGGYVEDRPGVYDCGVAVITSHDGNAVVTVGGRTALNTSDPAALAAALAELLAILNELP